LDIDATGGPDKVRGMITREEEKEEKEDMNKILTRLR